MAQILINSRMCAEGHRPICQDTGIVNAFVKLGMDVRFASPAGGSPSMGLQEMVDEGVRRAYLDPDNKLRASVLADPAGARKNTTRQHAGRASPSNWCRGNTVEVTVAAKGGGSEAKSKFVMLNPSDSVVDWVLKTVPTMGAGLVPAGHSRHRHRRHGGEGDAAGQAIADGPDRHSGPASRAAQRPPRRSCASNSTTR